MHQYAPLLLAVAFLWLAAQLTPAQAAEPTAKQSADVPFTVQHHFSFGADGPVLHASQFEHGDKVTIRYRIQLKPDANAAAWEGLSVSHCIDTDSGEAACYSGIDVKDEINPGDRSYTGSIEVDTQELSPGQWNVTLHFSNENTGKYLKQAVSFQATPKADPSPIRIRFLNPPFAWHVSAGSTVKVVARLDSKLPRDTKTDWHVRGQIQDAATGKDLTQFEKPADQFNRGSATSLEDDMVTEYQKIAIPFHVHQSGKLLLKVQIEERISQQKKNIAFPIVVVSPFDSPENTSD